MNLSRKSVDNSDNSSHAFASSVACVAGCVYSWKMFITVTEKLISTKPTNIAKEILLRMFVQYIQ